jgi:ketose-bisphosphate aldolase
MQGVLNMSSIPCVDLLKHARENFYAVGYFEAWNLESLLAVVRAAEIARSPVMIGFCGEYLASPKRKFKEEINFYGQIAKRVAADASVPVATLLNESTDINVAYKGVQAGFDMVMFVDEEMHTEDLIWPTRKLVEFAHACGVAVEGEVGALGMVEQGSGTQRSGNATDPDLAARFVQCTGVDALAVSVGNIHFLEGKKAELDFDLLEVLHRKLPVPLVLHGGTGVDKADFKASIARGIAKVNVGSCLKRTVLDSERDYFNENDVKGMNPNDVLGRGGTMDLMVRSQEALIEEVLGFIRAFGAENQAV